MQENRDQLQSVYDFSLADIVHFANDIVIVTEAAPLIDDGPRILYVNAAFTDVTGYTAEEVLGRTPRLLQGPETSKESRRRIRRALQRKEPIREIVLNYAKSGRKYWLDINIIPLKNSKGEVTFFAAIERDLTEQKDLESKLAKLAWTDGLTGLMNRRRFLERAHSEFARAKRYSHPLSLIVFDVDHFKQINDTFGHGFGDRVLSELGKTVRVCFRETDFCGRLGGEEFALVLPETPLDSAVNAAERLRRNISGLEISKEGKQTRITISLGVATVLPRDEEWNSAFQRADEALYCSKRQGRNRTTAASPAAVHSLPQALS